MEFEELLTLLGSCKKYQIILFFVLGARNLIGCIPDWLAVFTYGVPDYRCAIPGYENDTYTVQNEAHQLLINDSVPQGSKCTLFNSTVNDTSKCTSWVYEQTYYLPSAAMEFDLVCDKVVYRSIANMMYMFGMLLGSVVGGVISDRFGRRKALLSAVLVQGLSEVATAVTPDIYSHIFFRILLSGSGLVAYQASFILCLEMVGASKRQVLGVCISLFSAFGGSVTTLLAYFIRNWRHLTLVSSSLFALLISYWWLVPESTRWLLVRGRKKEAAAIFERVARVNKRKLPPDFIDDLIIEKTTIKSESFKQLLRNRTCLIRLSISTLTWTAISTSYYALQLNSGNLSGNLYINCLAMTVIEIPAVLLALFLPFKFGRRKPITSCLIVGGVCMLASLFVVIFGTEDHKWILTALSTIGRFCATAAFSLVYLQTVELFPTSLRNRAMGFCSAFTRIASVVAPFISDLGTLIESRFSDALPLIVLGALCITAGVLGLFLPETYGTPLPQSIEEAVNIGKGKMNDQELNEDGISSKEQENGYARLTAAEKMEISKNDVCSNA